MSEKLTKLIVTTILNSGIEGSEVKNWHFKVREVDGIYVVDLSTSIAISPKTHLTKDERWGKALKETWVAAFALWITLGTIGMLLPDANIGREIVLISGVPGFVAQLIAARFLIKAYRRRGQKEEEAPVVSDELVISSGPEVSSVGESGAGRSPDA